MPYIDRINLRRLEWIIENAGNVNLGKSYVKGHLVGGDAQLELLRKYYKRALMFEGNVPVSYYQIDDDGRRFSHDISLTNLSRPIRHTISEHMMDIDVKNCHPVIVLWLCKKHGIECNYIEQYVMNRDEMLHEMMAKLGISRDTAKKRLLKATNRDDGHFQQTENDPEWLYDYHQQCKKIADALSKFYPEYMTQAEKSKKRKDQSAWNMKGSALNRLLCHHENEILKLIEAATQRHNGTVMNLAYDGCMIDDTFAPEEVHELFADVTSEVQKMYPGMVFMMDVKNMNEGYSVPDSYQTKKELKQKKEEEKKRKQIQRVINKELDDEDDEEEYQEWKILFEQEHCKIMDPVGIVYKNSLDEYEFHSPASLCEKFSHRGKKYCGFIGKWWYDETMRVYARADMYSPTENCPKNVYNLWKPYPYESKVVEMTPHKMEMVYLVLYHVKILCGHDEAAYEYMINWIAQFIQYPQVKTTMPTFASLEGSGKNSFQFFLEKLIGKRQICCTTSAEDIFGKFNGLLANVRLVVLNELSATELRHFDGKLKGLITDDTVTIQGKGKELYPIRSMHRLLNFSNKTDHPIQTSEDDRRKLIMRCSDEKIGDDVYFSRLYEAMDDEDVLTWFFTFFSTKDVKAFNDTKGRCMPKTEYQLDIVQSYSNVIEDWLNYVLEEYLFQRNEKELLWSSQEQLTSFREYSASHGIKLELDSNKLGVRLTRLIKDKHIQGIENKPSSRTQRRHFNLPLIHTSYKPRFTEKKEEKKE